MKNKLAWIRDLNDVTTTVTEQRVHILSLSLFEVRITNLKKKVSWAELWVI